jgi:hypothetical protein
MCPAPATRPDVRNRREKNFVANWVELALGDNAYIASSTNGQMVNATQIRYRRHMPFELGYIQADNTSVTKQNLVCHNQMPRGNAP